MNTSTEKDLPFEYREIPEITTENKKNQNRYKEVYLERYMKDKKRPVIQEDILEKLNDVKKKYGFKSYDKTIEHLCDLDTKVDPVFERRYNCKTCNDPIEIPQGANVNKFVHSDLCTDKSCRGHIITTTKMRLDPRDGTVISRKDIKRIKEVTKYLEKQKKARNKQADKSEEQSEEQSEELVDNEIVDNEIVDKETGRTLRQIIEEIDGLENTSENVKEILKNQWRDCC